MEFVVLDLLGQTVDRLQASPMVTCEVVLWTPGPGKPVRRSFHRAKGPTGAPARAGSLPEMADHWANGIISVLPCRLSTFPLDNISDASIFAVSHRGFPDSYFSYTSLCNSEIGCTWPIEHY